MATGRGMTRGMRSRGAGRGAARGVGLPGEWFFSLYVICILYLLRLCFHQRTELVLKFWKCVVLDTLFFSV